MNKIAKFIGKNSPTILIGTGIAGFVGTVIFAAKGVPKARILMIEKRMELDDSDKVDRPEVEKLKIYAAAIPAYIPSIVLGSFSIFCFLFANKIHLDRQAALFGAYSFVDKTLTAYKEELADKLEPKALKGIEDGVARRRVETMQLEPPKDVYIVNEDEQLFMDGVTGQVFKSTIQEVREAEYQVNKELGTCIGGAVDHNFFMDCLGLQHTKAGEILGWDILRSSGDHMDIRFINGNLKNGKPCWILQYDVEALVMSDR